MIDLQDFGADDLKVYEHLTTIVFDICVDVMYQDFLATRLACGVSKEMKPFVTLKYLHDFIEVACETTILVRNESTDYKYTTNDKYTGVSFLDIKDAYDKMQSLDLVLRRKKIKRIISRL